MKKLSKSLLITAGLVSAFMVSNVLADDTVHFLPEVKGQQYFECTANSAGPYTMQTHNVDAQGFCPSGRVEGVTKEVANNSYFSVNDAGKDPSVSITGGDITCKVVKDHSKPNDFGAGQGFCSTFSISKK
jgi:hypothetical protein